MIAKGNYLDDYYNQYLNDSDLNIINILNPNIEKSVFTYLSKQTIYADQLIPISNLSINEVNELETHYRITAKSGTGFKGAFDFTLNKVSTKNVINVRVSKTNEGLSHDMISDKLNPLIKKPIKIRKILKHIYKLLDVYFYEDGKEAILVPSNGCDFSNASIVDNNIYVIILYWHSHYKKYFPIGIEPSINFDLNEYLFNENVYEEANKQLDYYFPYKDQITKYYNNKFDLSQSKLRILFCAKNTHYIYKQQDILEITIGQ